MSVWCRSRVSAQQRQPADMPCVVLFQTANSPASVQTFFRVCTSVVSLGAMMAQSAAPIVNRSASHND